MENKKLIIIMLFFIALIFFVSAVFFYFSSPDFGTIDSLAKLGSTDGNIKLIVEDNIFHEGIE